MSHHHTNSIRLYHGPTHFEAHHQLIRPPLVVTLLQLLHSELPALPVRLREFSLISTTLTSRIESFVVNNRPTTSRLCGLHLRTMGRRLQ